jgi:ADP-ribosylglycohydrolase
MTIAIAEALATAGEKDVETIMGFVENQFIQWYDSPENNRAPGNTCLRGVSRLKGGVNWAESGEARSKGSGSVMRIAPVGYLYQHDTKKLNDVAHATGISTHGHPTAVAASVGGAYAIKLVLDGVPPKRLIYKLHEYISGITEEFDKAIEKITYCLGWKDEEKALDYLGKGWVAEEALALALYCFLKYPDDYEKTVLRSANTEGDSDTIACIAGGISGAYLGFRAIRQDWVKRIEKSDYLNDLAIRLAEKKREISPL